MANPAPALGDGHFIWWEVVQVKAGEDVAQGIFLLFLAFFLYEQRNGKVEQQLIQEAIAEPDAIVTMAGGVRGIVKGQMIPREAGEEFVENAFQDGVKVNGGAAASGSRGVFGVEEGFNEPALERGEDEGIFNNKINGSIFGGTNGGQCLELLASPGICFMFIQAVSGHGL
jgi:hypothetical protein